MTTNTSILINKIPTSERAEMGHHNKDCGEATRRVRERVPRNEEACVADDSFTFASPSSSPLDESREASKPIIPEVGNPNDVCGAPAENFKALPKVVKIVGNRKVIEVTDGLTGVGYGGAHTLVSLERTEDDIDRLYTHENVRKYRRPGFKSSREWRVFVDKALEIGENFYYGDFVYTAKGNKIWTWKLYQMTPFMVSDLRARTERRLRKCGRRVVVKPYGVNACVLEQAQRDYPRASVVALRRALSTIEAPKYLDEYAERRDVIRENLTKCGSKLLTYHYYKDQLRLVSEGVEPNPGPTYQEFELDCRREEQSFFAYCESRLQMSKEEVRDIRNIIPSARFHRAAAYAGADGVIDAAAFAAHASMLENMKRDDRLIIDDLVAMRFFLDSDTLCFTPASGFTGGKDGWKYSTAFTCRFLYTFMDLAGTDCELKGSAFQHYIPNAMVTIGNSNKTNLLEEMPVTDPRVAAQKGDSQAAIASVNNTLIDQGEAFTRKLVDDCNEDGETFGRKRDSRRKVWSSETAVPLGLLDLARYVYAPEDGNPYAIYGLYKGLVEIYKQTGEYKIDPEILQKTMKSEIRRGEKNATAGLAKDFTFSAGMFPFYFSCMSEEDRCALSAQGLEFVDTVSTEATAFPLKASNVFELVGDTVGDKVALKVRALTAPEPEIFLYDKTWFKMAVKRSYGCTDTYKECLLLCRTYLSWTDHSNATAEMGSMLDLRVRAFAAAVWGTAKARPTGNLSKAEILRRIAEYRPIADGTYVEPYTTDDSCITDKYAELALPCYRVGSHTVDNSFIAIRDPATVKHSDRSRLARVGPECLLRGYARPDPEALDEQLSGIIKRLSVGKILLSDEWKTRLEKEVWPEVKAYLEAHQGDMDIITPNQIYDACVEHAKSKGYGRIETHDYLMGVSLFLAGANGDPNLLPPEWRTEYGCFTKSENYALSGRKPCRSIQCPDLYVRGYQHALLFNAQHNLFVKVFPHLSIKHKTEEQKVKQISRTFANTHRIVCTDLTAMEKNVTNYMMTFEREVFKACSPKWMHAALDDAWHELMTTNRSIAHKMFDLFVDPMRASGEDHTSAGNFVCNLMWICAWTGDTHNILNGSRPCMVEGDDGQVSADGLDLPDAKSIAGLGIRIKLEETVDMSAFVSKVIRGGKQMCDALSIAQNFSIIRDPDFTTNHTDAAKQYAMAMSYYYLYGGFPIVGPYFFQYLMRHHDAVMGNERGIRAVRRAFEKKYEGYMAPQTIEAMWQDALEGISEPKPASTTTAQELADYCGVSQLVLEQIYRCRFDLHDQVVPSGGVMECDDVLGSLKAVQAEKKIALEQPNQRFQLIEPGKSKTAHRRVVTDPENPDEGVYYNVVEINDVNGAWSNNTILPKKETCSTDSWFLTLMITALMAFGAFAWPLISSYLRQEVPIAGLLDYEPAPIALVPDILINTCRFCEVTPAEGKLTGLPLQDIALIGIWLVNVVSWISIYLACRLPRWIEDFRERKMMEDVAVLFDDSFFYDRRHLPNGALALEWDDEADGGW